MSILQRIRDARDVALGVKVGADASLLHAVPALKTQVESLANALKIAQDTAAFSIRGIGLGGEAKWNRTITDADREWASTRTPVGHFVTFSVAEDMFDNWFTVDDLRTEGNDEELDVKIQNVLTTLHARETFTAAATLERIHGFSAIAVGFTDGDDLSQPVRPGADIRELYAYGKNQLTVDRDVTDETSERYGLPELYTVKRLNLGDTTIHWSRMIHCATRKPIEIGKKEWEGISVLDPAYNDLEMLDNIRWSIGQTMFRYGPGFPDIELQGASDDVIEAFYASGRFSNINARTYFVHSEREKLEFKGVGSSALDPQRYTQPIMESLSVATKIPEPILRGAQAGALTGSEVNEREYFKVVSSAQTAFERYLRVLIDALMASGQIEAEVEDYQINWVGGFEVNAKDKALTELAREQAQQIRLEYMLLDEVRALCEATELGPLPHGEGKMLKQASNPFSTGGSANEDYLVRRYQHPTAKEAPTSEQPPASH